MAVSKAIYLEETGELTVHEITETYTPTDQQSLVSVKYSAINPADLRHYYIGFHSYVAGYEVCSLRQNLSPLTVEFLCLFLTARFLLFSTLDQSWPRVPTHRSK